MADSEAEAARTRKERREAIVLAARRERRRTRTLVLTCVFGLLGPAACFCIYWSVDLGMFGPAELAVHIATFVAVLSLAIHVSQKSPPARFSAFLGGVMQACALQALIVALCLLPVSLLLLILVIGVFGLIPFGTAWTLHRAAREAREIAASLPRRERVALAIGGFALSMALPLAYPTAQFVAYETAFDRIDMAHAGALEEANDALDWVPWLSSRPLIDEALACEDDERFQRLSNLCERQFGFALDPEYGYDSD